jgi:hypothetical protein
MGVKEKNNARRATSQRRIRIKWFFRIMLIFSFFTFFVGWMDTYEPQKQNKNNLPLEESLHCVKSLSLPNGWCMDSNMVPRYVGPDCSNVTTIVRKYTHEGFSKCLANKTVVFIGDSRVRYQYMHLAGLLTYKRFMKCADQLSYQNRTDSDQECYLIKLHHNWPTWYEGLLLNC